MKRRAFTLIEILVAITIIVILGGLAVYAMHGSGNTAKIQATRVTLDNLKSMLAEYELQTKLLIPPPGGWLANAEPYPPAAVSTPAGADFWRNITGAPNNPLNNPGLVGDTANGSPRFTSCATNNTVIAVNEFLKIPGDKAAFAKLSPGSLMQLNGGRIVLDAWGNPIIFVPAIGLAGVSISGGAPITITAPNGRPFFASAGPDGNFTNGDDNLYSFEQ